MTATERPEMPMSGQQPGRAAEMLGQLRDAALRLEPPLRVTTSPSTWTLSHPDLRTARRAAQPMLATPIIGIRKPVHLQEAIVIFRTAQIFSSTFGHLLGCLDPR